VETALRRERTLGGPVRFADFYTFFVIVTSLYRVWVSTRIPGVKKSPGAVKAPFTFWALTIGYVVVVAASVTEYLLVRRDDSGNLAVSVLGLAIYLFGIVGREWPIRELARFWSHQVEIRSDHELILSGPYRHLRHPNYACLLCEVLGFPLVSNSYFAVLLSAIIYIPLVLVRIRHEEAALIEKFGDRYREYRRCVPALLPMPGRTTRDMASPPIPQGGKLWEHDTSPGAGEPVATEDVTEGTL